MPSKARAPVPKERIEAVRGYWAHGWSASDIACRLNITRNAVIGIVDRHLHGIVRHKSKNSPKAKAALKVMADAPKAEPRPAPAPRKMKLPEPVNLALNMMDLTQESCRFPHGDGPFVFCGQKTDEDHPYCPYHAEFTHQAGSAISGRSGADQRQHSGHPASTS